MNKGFEIVGGCPLRDAMPKADSTILGQHQAMFGTPKAEPVKAEREFEKILDSARWNKTQGIYMLAPHWMRLHNGELDELNAAHRVDMQALRDQLKQSTKLIDAQRTRIAELDQLVSKIQWYVDYANDKDKEVTREMERANIAESQLRTANSYCPKCGSKLDWSEVTP